MVGAFLLWVRPLVDARVVAGSMLYTPLASGAGAVACRERTARPGKRGPEEDPAAGPTHLSPLFQPGAGWKGGERHAPATTLLSAAHSSAPPQFRGVPGSHRPAAAAPARPNRGRQFRVSLSHSVPAVLRAPPRRHSTSEDVEWNTAHARCAHLSHISHISHPPHPIPLRPLQRSPPPPLPLSALPPSLPRKKASTRKSTTTPRSSAMVKKSWSCPARRPSTWWTSGRATTPSTRAP